MDATRDIARTLADGLEGPVATLVSGTVERGAMEIASLLSDDAVGALAGLLVGVRVHVALTPEDAGRAHFRIRARLLDPFPPLCVGLPGDGDPFGEVVQGEECPDIYLRHWFPVARDAHADPAAAREFFSASAAAARHASPHAPARAMARALLGPVAADWYSPAEADSMFRALEGAAGRWLGSESGDTGVLAFADELVTLGEGLWGRSVAFARLGRAWTALRSAAWGHLPSADWFGPGYPRAEAAAFREALRSWQATAGPGAQEAFAATFLSSRMESTGGHTYLSWAAPDGTGPMEADLLLAPHGPFTMTRSLEGTGQALRCLLAHEIGHVLWNAWMPAERRSAYGHTWAEAKALPSVLALSSPEECFAEHLAALLRLSWGDAYVRHRRSELGLGGPASRRRAAALESLGMLEAFVPEGRAALDAAAGCFRAAPR